MHQVALLKNRELFTLFILFVSFGTAYLASQFGISLALGAFIAGLLISESEYSHQMVSDLLPLRDCFSGVFFMSVGMLLDVTNVLVDSRNRGFDARARVREYPLAAIRQVHLAGGVRDRDGRWIDSHSEPVAEESYALLGELARSPLQAIVVERDHKLGTLAELVAEAVQAEAACR